MNKLIILALVLISTKSMSQEFNEIRYFDNQTELNGLITNHSENNLPAVLILPAWMGIDEEAKTAAKNLADKGYLALIADIYGKGNIPINVEEAKKITTYYKTNYKEYQHRIQLGLETLLKNGANPDKIVIIGYCFGGTGALEAARGNLKVNGVVSIHGNLTDGRNRNNEILPQILIENGADDASVSETDIQNFMKEMKEAKAVWQFNNYGNSKHTFTNPESADYNEVMSKKSWIDTVEFIQNLIK